MSVKHRGPGRPPKSAKKLQAEHMVPHGFWAQVGAILMIIFAIILFIGLFGIGGPAPTGLASGMRWLIGWTAFVLPFVFIFQAIQIFRSQGNQVPGVIWGATILFIWFFAGLFQLMLVSPSSLVDSQAGNGGGTMGWLMADGWLQFVNIPVAALIFVVFLLILVLFVFSISPKSLFSAIANFFRRENAEDDVANNKVVAEKTLAKDKIEEKIETNEEREERLKEVEEKVRHNHTDDFRDGSRADKSDKRSDDEIRETFSSVEKPDNTNWELPSLELLSTKKIAPDPGDRKKTAQLIEDALEEENFRGEVVDWATGPRVTQYYLQMQRGTNLPAVASEKVEAKLKMNLQVESVRIEAPVPGKPYIGIEVPNKKSAFIGMRAMLESPEWSKIDKPLSFAVGQDTYGKMIMMSLLDLPHLLIAGTTNSGKSVMMNLIITSMLYRESPDEVKFVMVDPKGTEMIQYKDMPHLAGPVLLGLSKNEISRTARTLSWLSEEINRRFEKFGEVNTRNYKDYVRKVPDDKLPYIVLIIDEWTSLLDSAKNDRETILTAVQQIAQRGRAAGIHEILVMQAPRAKYIPGAIRANITAGFCFAVLSKMESQQIIQSSGGEKLLGKGDMLMKTIEIKSPKRVQSAFVDDSEIDKIVYQLKMQSQPQYDEDLLASLEHPIASDNGGLVTDMGDDEYRDAVRVVVEAGKASTSLLQRKLRIGYSKAARIMEEMEDNGIIGEADGSRPRDVLISSVDDLDE